MNARTTTFPSVGENVEMVEKYASRPKRMRRPSSGSAAISASRTRLSHGGRRASVRALAATRRKRQV